MHPSEFITLSWVADAVIALEKNRESAKSMGQSARAYVVKHFDRHNHSEAFAELILKLENE